MHRHFRTCLIRLMSARLYAYIEWNKMESWPSPLTALLCHRHSWVVSMWIIVKFFRPPLQTSTMLGPPFCHENDGWIAQGRSQNLYTTPCNGAGSHGLELGVFGFLPTRHKRRQNTSTIFARCAAFHVCLFSRLDRSMYAPDESLLFVIYLFKPDEFIQGRS